MISLGITEQGRQGIRDLATALYVWESRFEHKRGDSPYEPRERTPDQRVQRVLLDLDDAALHADALVLAKYDQAKLYHQLDSLGDAYAGPMRRFFREVAEINT